MSNDDTDFNSSLSQPDDIIPISLVSKNAGNSVNVNGAADGAIGALLILCMVVGIPGNLVSIFYFFTKATKSVHNTLYMVACLTDTCTLLTAVGPISVLISDTGRSEMVFENSGFCQLWTVIFYFVLRFSLFVVMMISISRTSSIMLPFRVINTKAVIWVCIIYATWILTKDTLFIGMDAVHPEYYEKHFASCVYFYNSSEPLGVAYLAFGTAEVALVAIIIIINFVISLVYFIKKPKLNVLDASKFRNVSITITIFTAVCIACILPMIILLILQLFHVNRYMTDLTLSYARVMTHVFMIVLNAAINPCVYMLRMPSYFQWARKRSINLSMKIRDATQIMGKESHRETLGETQMETYKHKKQIN